ncbi:MAG: hypothetical protein ACSLFL_14900 [Alphaproteobacteria bacterium]
MKQTVPGVMLTVFITVLPVSAIAADTVVTCKDAQGYANYHYTDLVPREKSGFEEDKTTGGLTTLVRTGQDEYDLLFVDIRQKIISSRSDGGTVRLLRKGKNDATFLIIYPGMAIELYTFYRDPSGSEKFDIIQSKGGDGMPIHKSSVMMGNCSGLDLNLLD